MSYLTNKASFTSSTETAPPTLHWATNATVTVTPATGQGTTVRRRLQDGKVRTFTTSLTWNNASDWEAGSSESSNDWAMLFLVPDSSDDGQLDVIASENDPATGPDGYTNFEYLGAVYNNGSSNLIEFDQIGSWMYFRRADQWKSLIAVSGTVSLGSWIAVDISHASGSKDFPPAGIVGRFLVNGGADSDSTDIWNIVLATNSGTPTYTPGAQTSNDTFISMQDSSQAGRCQIFYNVDEKIYVYYTDTGSNSGRDLTFNLGLNAYQDRHLEAKMQRSHGSAVY